jgi:hypothetical protein
MDFIPPPTSFEVSLPSHVILRPQAKDLVVVRRPRTHPSSFSPPPNGDISSAVEKSGESPVASV